MPPLPAHITVADATPADLASLATIHTRSFHPTILIHRRTLPDTPAVRDWWQRSFAGALADAASRVLVALDDGVVVGVLKMRRFEAGEGGLGTWEEMLNNLPDECDKELQMPIIEKMAPWREELLPDQANIAVEFFGTDNKYQRRGVGSALLGRCCELADAEGLPLFVEANQYAESFYQRYGFASARDAAFGEQGEYRLFAMVRPKKT